MVFLKLLSVVLTAFAALSADASPLSSCGLKKMGRWNISLAAPTLRYAVKNATGDDEAYADYAFHVWEAVPTAYVAFTKVADPAAANIVVVFASDKVKPGGGGQAFGEFDDDCYFKTCEAHIISTGRKALVHEVGHCLGLGHSVVEDAVMSYREKTEPILPNLDDRYALTVLYPNEGEPSFPPGCGTMSSTPGGGSGGTWAFFCGLMLLFYALSKKSLIKAY